MILLSIYNVLLAKFSGQEDIVVGSPIAGRSHKAFEPILGMFVNTLAMRNFPEGEKRFPEFLEEVKLNATDAYANQDYPFESLVSQLKLERDLGRTPLFDTMFSFQSTYNNEEPPSPEQGKITIEPFPFTGSSAKFDLVLEIFEEEDIFTLNAEYCIDLFSCISTKTLLNKLLRSQLLDWQKFLCYL